MLYTSHFLRLGALHRVFDEGCHFEADAECEVLLLLCSLVSF